MATGRKNSCPVSIKDWLVQAKVKGVGNTFTTVHGLSTLTYTIDSDTEDGSAATDPWAEPYVTKRNGSLSLEGKPVAQKGTGEVDAGQVILNDAALATRCDGDITVRFVDDVGHATVADYIVTSRETGIDDDGPSISWDLEQVGEAEEEAWVAPTAIAVSGTGISSDTLTLAVGASTVVTVAFTPATTSNTKFTLTPNYGTSGKFFKISNVTETGFTVTALKNGGGTISVKSVAYDSTGFPVTKDLVVTVPSA